LGSERFDPRCEIDPKTHFKISPEFIRGQASARFRTATIHHAE
jgi:hypothetical protein